ncbi:MAG: 4-(cytidine 5'-diphospho)-2-C-methyl-D-erythritol kinase [Mycobacteriales bacterium]
MTARRTPTHSVVVRAPAKVNLHLAVGSVRPDGYHDLTTVFHAIGLYDDVTLTRSRGLTVRVEGEGAERVPTDHSNLAARAVLALAERTGHEPDVEIHLSKGIPVAGGCAGGSADAAAALVGCDALWDLGMSRAELMAVGAGLGSDVPFALHGGTALGTGRGERLTPVLGAGSWSWVLALADGGLSTPAVYAELDRLRATGPVSVVSDSAEVLSALRSASPDLLGRALSNDLQRAAVALKPDLRRLLEAGQELGALGGVVSGSGPTVAFLARSGEHATDLAAALSGHGVCRTVRTAEGPVPGARVVRSD